MGTNPIPTPSTGTSVIAAIEVSLALLQGTLTAIPATAEYAPIISLIEASIAKLVEAQSTPVTFGELEGYRIQKLW